MVKHKTKHRCEILIYFDLDAEIIKEKGIVNSSIILIPQK